jgi:predicted HicB family RNase H-like nuclease
MENLSYRGFSWNIEYSKADNCFCGKVLGLPKNILIMYEGNTASELYNDFKAGIDHYLESCKAKGIQPCKSYSGTLNLRIPSEIHCKVAMLAKKNGTSINSFIRDSIERRLEHVHCP